MPILFDRRDIPKIGGSSTGFILLVVFLVSVIVFSTVSLFILIRSTPSSTPANYRSRPRHHHHHYRQESVPSNCDDPPAPTHTPTPVLPLSSGGKKHGWRWPTLFGRPNHHNSAATTTMRAIPVSTTSPKSRGWIQAGSGEWEFDNDLDNGDDSYPSPPLATQTNKGPTMTTTTTTTKGIRYTSTPFSSSPLPPLPPPPPSSSIEMEDSPFRAPTSESAHYSLSESVVSSSVHFNLPHYGRGSPTTIAGPPYSPASLSPSSSSPHPPHHHPHHHPQSPSPPSPSPHPPRPIMTSQLSSSPPSSPQLSPIPTPTPTSILRHGHGRGSGSGSGSGSGTNMNIQDGRHDSMQSIWTFQGGTKFIESL